MRGVRELVHRPEPEQGQVLPVVPGDQVGVDRVGGFAAVVVERHFDRLAGLVVPADEDLLQDVAGADDVGVRVLAEEQGPAADAALDVDLDGGGEDVVLEAGGVAPAGLGETGLHLSEGARDVDGRLGAELAELRAGVGERGVGLVETVSQLLNGDAEVSEGQDEEGGQSGRERGNNGRNFHPQLSPFHKRTPLFCGKIFLRRFGLRN
jgi:hypothetical protein